MSSKYKDKMGRFRTASLFVEINNSNETPVYTFADEDKKLHGRTYKSAKKIYLSCNDPTEYEQAIAIVGSWEHWRRLRDNIVISEHINKWREELEIRIKSEAIKALSIASLSQPTAAKYLAEMGWKSDKKIPAPRGRPRNKNSNNNNPSSSYDVEEDYERLKKLHVV